MIQSNQSEVWHDCDSMEKQSGNRQTDRHPYRQTDQESLHQAELSMSATAWWRLIFSEVHLLSVYFDWVGVHYKREDDSGLWDKKQTCPWVIQEKKNVNSSILAKFVVILSRRPLSEVKCSGNKRNDLGMRVRKGGFHSFSVIIILLHGWMLILNMAPKVAYV